MKEDWKECKLGEVCYFAKDKVSVSELNNDIYISTENMMPNRGGITKATNLPTGEQTPSFESGDILVSNIRPYFKKIWKATFSGGCSADVLNFKAKNNIANDFLYYVLSDDEFFKYCMTTSKGTKMPRGDKVAIMQYPITLPPLATQQKIAKILSSLDDKIELNNKINTNLEQQAQALFKNWFVDFEPFGGKMPEGWKEGTVSEIIVLHDSKRIPLSSQQREKMEKKYPYYGATSLMDYVDNYLFDGIFLLLGEDGTVIDSEGFPILQYVEGKFWVNNHAHILTGKNGFSVEMLYLLFSLTNVKDKVTGAVQQKISQGNLNSITTIIPPEEVCKKFDLLIQPLFAQIRNLKQENDRLSELRDTLLPKLMNGEIEVGIK
ncbi:MAG: restriction endonuclease subunit S [Spirochaetia bacterium]|nr:restriction endonuclease subunit S [Spirochaetia bacterium]